VHVGEMPPESMATRRKKMDDITKAVRGRIEKARALQRRRFAKAKGVATNADMGPKEIEGLAGLTPKAEDALQGAARSMKLSPRGYHRTIKLARTIADLAESASIDPAHMLEALQYRAREL
ncbi:MAG: magnesium chelatase, partial [Patescibacteria group bacterium]|nr:magnesium chelatase [Patescibacteria group bacterium]